MVITLKKILNNIQSRTVFIDTGQVDVRYLVAVDVKHFVQLSVGVQTFRNYLGLSNLVSGRQPIWLIKLRDFLAKKARLTPLGGWYIEGREKLH